MPVGGSLLTTLFALGVVPVWASTFPAPVMILPPKPGCCVGGCVFVVATPRPSVPGALPLPPLVSTPSPEFTMGADVPDCNGAPLAPGESKPPATRGGDCCTCELAVPAPLSLLVLGALLPLAGACGCVVTVLEGSCMKAAGITGVPDVLPDPVSTPSPAESRPKGWGCANATVYVLVLVCAPTLFWLGTLLLKAPRRATSTVAVVVGKIASRMVRSNYLEFLRYFQVRVLCVYKCGYVRTWRFETY